MFSRKIKYILAGIFCIFLQQASAATLPLSAILAPSPDDKPTPAEVAQIIAAIKAGDYSSSYYYGPAWEHGGKKYPVDYVKARKFAYVEMTTPDIDSYINPSADEPITSGAQTLMMIYANGLGVPKNIDFAKKLSMMGDVDADAIDALDKMQHDPYANPIDFSLSCNVPGPYYGSCIAAHYAKENDFRLADTDALSANWTPAEKTALQNLLKTADVFFHQSISEDPISGCAKDGEDKGSQEMKIVADKRDQLTRELKQFAAGKIPSYTKADFLEGDRTLNENYQHALSILKRERIKEAKYYADPKNNDFSACDGPSLPEVSDIVTLEKSWMQYRDAWVQLGALRYPSVPAEVWKAWMTRQRNMQIGNFISNIAGNY